MSKNKPVVLLLGKLPPPFIGPAIAAQILLNSNLKNEFDIIFLNIAFHRNASNFGKYHFLNFFKTLNLYLRFLYHLIIYNPQLVYLPSQHDRLGYLRDTGLILMTKLFRKKIICHLRGGFFKNWYDTENGFMKWLVHRVHPLIDAQIVLGENLKYLYSFLLPAEKIFVVPNGGNYNFPEKTKKNDLIRILFIGNLIRMKGVLDFLYAIPLIKKNHKIEFVVAGEPWESDVYSEITTFISENDQYNIKLICPVFHEEKMSLLINSDIFVFPTYYTYEGHPWVIIEAMAAGLPVITTNLAAISESVIDGVNGFLVEKKNPNEIAGKINYLIENPENLNHMGKESLRLYNENFTEEHMIIKLSEVFKKCLTE